MYSQYKYKIKTNLSGGLLIGILMGSGAKHAPILEDPPKADSTVYSTKLNGTYRYTSCLGALCASRHFIKDYYDISPNVITTL